MKIEIIWVLYIKVTFQGEGTFWSTCSEVNYILLINKTTLILHNRRNLRCIYQYLFYTYHCAWLVPYIYEEWTLQ